MGGREPHRRTPVLPSARAASAALKRPTVGLGGGPAGRPKPGAAGCFHCCLRSDGNGGLPLGRSASAMELEPRVASSRANICLMKPAFGRTCGRRSLMKDSASDSGRLSRVTRYARHTDTDRLLPSWQCTKTRPPAATASSMARSPSSRLCERSWSSTSSRTRRRHFICFPSSSGGGRSEVQFTISVTPSLRRRCSAQAVTGPTSSGKGDRSQARVTSVAFCITLALEMICCRRTKSSYASAMGLSTLSPRKP
mmetsp:Transcript_49680/g.132496  ORF Transcript_49680/g.132496 Transcript_49680/m.132496 type:complete len:253 (+) Transcript_49680:61-819(+)